MLYRLARRPGQKAVLLIFFVSRLRLARARLTGLQSLRSAAACRVSPRPPGARPVLVAQWQWAPGPANCGKEWKHSTA